MKAMVLAAGLGERMVPLSLVLPKPAIPVLGRPIILEVLRGLARAGILDVTVNLHHKGDRLAELLAEGRPGPAKIHLSPEKSILGTGGGIRHASRFLTGSGTILVRNSDFLADIDLSAAVAAHRSSGAAATLVVAPARPGYSELAVDRDGRVLSIGGEPPVDPGRVAGRHLFTGCHLIEEEVLDLIPPRGPSDIVRHVYRRLAEEGRLHAVAHDGFWWEFGTPREYLEGSLRLLGLPAEVRRPILETDPVRTFGSASVAVGPGADLHAGVEFHGRAAIGFACMIAEGCRLEDTVVLPETWLGPGCRFRRCIVGPATEIPASFEADGAMVCADPDPRAELPPGTIRSQGLLIRSFEAGAP